MARTDLMIASAEEYRLIAILLANADLMPTAMARLTAEHFAQSPAQKYWRALSDAYQRTGALSLTALHKSLTMQGVSYTELTRDTADSYFLATSEELDACIDAIAMAYARRRLYHAAREIAAIVQKPEYDNPAALEVEAQSALWQAIRHVGSTGLVTLGAAVEEAALRMQEAASGRPTRRITTGFSATLDRRLGGGFAPGDLIILSGRTGTGKTASALAIATHVAARHGAVLYFSPEMSAEALGERALQMLGPIESEQLRSPDASALERSQRVVKRVAGWPFYIAEQRGITVPEIVARSQAFRMEHPDLSLVVIDHFGELAIPPGGDRNLPRTLGLMASRIRELAADLDVPILLLHQINRGVEHRGDKRPTKADLRDSGRLEEIADIILLLYREDDLPPGLEHLAEVIVAKNRRTGWTKTLVVEFLAPYVRYQDAEPERRAAYLRTILQRAEEGAA